MSNIKSIVNSHNKSITEEVTTNAKKSCNCTIKNNCPLNGNCLTENSLYAGILTSNLLNYWGTEYTGVTALEWKSRDANHKTSFNLRKYINSSELSKEVWKIY